MYSVLVFLVSACEWELISKCSFRCSFLCSSKLKIKEVNVPLPPRAGSVSLSRFFLSSCLSSDQNAVQGKTYSACQFEFCKGSLSIQYRQKQRTVSRVRTLEVNVDSTNCSLPRGGL